MAVVVRRGWGVKESCAFIALRKIIDVAVAHDSESKVATAF